MGIDWFRVKPKPGADPDELRTLAARQARAIRAIGRFWIDSPVDLPEEVMQGEEDAWMDEYRSSSDELAALLEPPPFDEDLGRCTDIPDLDPCDRVYAIKGNDLLPPQWRRDDSRSILPEELPSRLKAWRDWFAAVAEGAHRGYLLELWAYQETMSLYANWQALRRVALSTLPRTNNWAKKPRFLEARRRVLEYTPPDIHPAPAFPPPQGRYDWSESLRAQIEEAIVRQAALTREWDCCVKESFKLRCYEQFYQRFEDYIDGAKSDRLHEFLHWVERCCSHGFGLYWDY